METLLEMAFPVVNYASVSPPALANIPTASSIARRLTGQASPVPCDNLCSAPTPVYVDKDREATYDSLDVSSGKWQRISVLLPTVAELGASLADEW